MTKGDELNWLAKGGEMLLIIVLHNFLSSVCGGPFPALPLRLTQSRLQPLWLLFKVNEDVIGRDASEGNGKANSSVDRVRVQRHEDHEEARDAEDHWDEERHLHR